MSADEKIGFVGFGSDMSMNFAFNQSRRLFPKIGEESIQIAFCALSLKHDRAVWLISDPACDGVTLSDIPRAGTEADPLYASLKDDPLSGDHIRDCSG